MRNADYEAVQNILRSRQAVDAKVMEFKERVASDEGRNEEYTEDRWHLAPFASEKMFRTKASYDAHIRRIEHEFEVLRQRVAGEIMELAAICAHKCWVMSDREDVQNRQKFLERVMVIRRVAERKDAAFETKAGVELGWLSE